MSGELEKDDDVSDGSVFVREWCNIRSNLINFSYTLTIDNFSFYGEEVGEVINSPLFGEKASSDYKWSLKVYPNGKTDSIESEIKVKWNFCIFNSKKEPIRSKQSNGPHNFTKGTSFGYNKFIERSFLLDEANGALPYDKLIIHCDIEAIYGSLDTSGYSRHKLEEPTSRLSENFKYMLDSSLFSDCVVRVENVDINVHKSVLACRSPVFNRMFDSEFREKHSNIVQITDFSPSVVKEMIRFMYTDISPNLEKMANDLLAISDKYNVETLKELAEQVLCDNVTVQNVCEYYSIGELYSATLLKKTCFAFISLHTKDVMNTFCWDNFVLQHPKVIEKLFKESIQYFRRSPFYEFPSRKRPRFSNSF